MNVDKVELKSNTENTVSTSPALEIPRDKLGRVRWSIVTNNPDLCKSVIEIESQAFLARGFPLTADGLNRARQSTFRSVITGHYPGGLLALRATLAVEEPPRINSVDKRYTDPEGITWVPYYFFKREFGMANLTVKKMFQDIPTITGASSQGRKIILYQEPAAMNKISPFLSLPKVEPATAGGRL